MRPNEIEDTWRSKYTPETVERILNAIKCGAPQTQAAKAAGVTTRTIRRWRAEYEDFRERFERARSEGLVSLTAQIKIAAANDWRAAAWLLERLLPERFSMRYKIEHSGAIARSPDPDPQVMDALTSRPDLVEDLRRIRAERDAANQN